MAGRPAGGYKCDQGERQWCGEMTSGGNGGEEIDSRYIWKQKSGVYECVCLSIWSGYISSEEVWAFWLLLLRGLVGGVQPFPMGRILLLLPFFGPNVPGPDASHDVIFTPSNFPSLFQDYFIKWEVGGSSTL